MKNFILTLLFMSITFAQSTITGLVLDQSTGVPLKDANVSVLDDDGATIAGTSTDDSGKFALSLSESGKVQVSVIGYKNATVNLDLKDGDIQPLRFELVSQAVSLEGVRAVSYTHLTLPTIYSV